MAETAGPEIAITLMTAVAAGMIVIVVARRLQVSAIVLLLLGGFVLGPEVLDVVRPDSLGTPLGALVSLAVGVILFEGGLTLDIDGYRSTPRLIRRLLTVGVLVTWILTALAVRLLFATPVPVALLAASLVIVTGPTVIQPLLRRIRVVSRLHHVLQWEGVLIDPIGVFVAILCFEYIQGFGGEAAVASLALRILTGAVVGLVGGLVVAQVLVWRLVPEDLVNGFALASALLIFAGAEAFSHAFGFSDAGLLAVVIGGLVVGIRHPPGVAQIRRFKAELTELMIGMLFILLAARLRLDQFVSFGVRGALLVTLVILVVRPLAVAAASAGLGVGWRDRVFLSWVAPRGIVAASMASLFAIALEGRHGLGVEPTFLETFTYSVIAATVLAQGLTAAPLASVLDLRRPPRRGWLIVGAHRLARATARFLVDRAGVPVVLADLNARRVAQAREEGLAALHADARDLALEGRAELSEVGNLLALTDNEDLNALLCERWVDRFGSGHVHCWRSPRAEQVHRAESGGASAGRVVWSALPKPSLVAAELELGEATLHETGSPQAEAGGSRAFLLGLQLGHVVLGGASDVGRGTDGLDSGLWLERAAGYLRRSLVPGLILRVETESFPTLLREMVARIVRLVPQLPADRLVKELLGHEATISSGLGNGIAVPHAYSTAILQRLCAVAQVPEGLDLGGPDGEPVRLVFLVLSPAGDPAGHLATLAEIARIVSHDEARGRLLDAVAPEDFLATVESFSG